MAAVEANLHTYLTIQDAASVFQDVAHQARGMAAKLAERQARKAGNGDLHGFFTPTDNSPFAGLDPDEPHFRRRLQSGGVPDPQQPPLVS